MFGTTLFAGAVALTSCGGEDSSHTHSYVDGYCAICGEAEPSEGLEYTLSDDGTHYAVSGVGDCKDTDIVVPSEYNGLPVLSIEDYALQGCYSLTGVAIPDGVTYIGARLFRGVNRLQI